MNRFKFLFLLLLASILLSGCGSGESGFEPTADQQRQIAERIAPVGNIIMASDITSIDEAPLLANIQKISLSEGSEHIVKMLNVGDGGNMIFEPAVLKVSLGDTVHFKAIDMSHNSATIQGMVPPGASAWAGALSKDISVTLDTEGVYVYQCDPHAMMAMVGVIQVGEAVNMEEINAAAETVKPSFMLNAERLTGYLLQL
jgi:pseudoazurin